MKSHELLNKDSGGRGTLWRDKFKKCLGVESLRQDKFVCDGERQAVMGEIKPPWFLGEYW